MLKREGRKEERKGWREYRLTNKILLPPTRMFRSQHMFILYLVHTIYTIF